jgi:microcin C transport system substrate-binding protein
MTCWIVAVLLAFPQASPAQDAHPPTHALAISGSVKYPPGFSHFEYARPDAPKGGQVKMGALGAYDSLNPFIIKGVPASGLGLMYDTLTLQSLDEPFAEYGLVAEKIEIAPDRSWVIFHLNPQARFHNGQPIKADDVVFSFNLLREKGDPMYQKYWADVLKAEELDPARVRFALGDKSNPELPLILGQLVVLPKHYWERRNFSEPTLDPPLGSGPYRILDVKPGRSITYERVADYWGQNLGVNKGRNNFDRITYDYYRDENVLLHAFNAGEFDFRSENISKFWATGYTSPAIKDGFLIKEELPNDVNQGMQAFAYNLRRPLFQHPKVREALMYAFDFEWSNKNLFYGQYTRSASYFSNSELASQGLPSEAELKILEPYRDRLPAEVFTKEYRLPVTDGSGNNRTQLKMAMDLLQAAGWVIKNGKRVNEKTGEPFRFEILLHSPTFERVVAPFAQNLGKLGIDATYRTVDTSQYIRRVQDFDFDMVVSGWGQSQSPGNEQREFWGSEAAGLPGSRNYTGLRNPVVDELVEKLIQAPTREDLVNHCKALDRVLLWQHLVIPQWHTAVDRVAYWNKLVRPTVVPRYALDIMAWWVDPKKEKALGEYKAKTKRDGS